MESQACPSGHPIEAPNQGPPQRTLGVLGSPQKREAFLWGKGGERLRRGVDAEEGMARVPRDLVNPARGKTTADNSYALVA